MLVRCGCAIIPALVLDRIADDASFAPTTRAACAASSEHGRIWRAYRTSLSPAARHVKGRPATPVPPLPPGIHVFDCKGSTTQPGDLVARADLLASPRAKAVAETLQTLTGFYRTIFNRNSVDNHGMGLFASIRYGQTYCNAFWNGQQMVFGDGDGEAFADFAFCEDTLAHEFAHAVTQFTIGLGYADEAGALNESLSDVFASVFRQWRQHQPSDRADWSIGSALIGPDLQRRGYRALRNLMEPDAADLLTPQPRHMRDYDRGGDPHINSGIPNHAFQMAALTLGGNSWDRTALIWYSALASSRRSPNMTFAEFAALTVHRATMLFRMTPAVPRIVEQAWKDVGVL